MIENSISAKHQRMSSADHKQLVELLISKDKEMKTTLKTATEQAKIEHKIKKLRAEVNIQDQEICGLQKKLKEAEQTLSTALFQARQKLDSISKANKKCIPSEDLIKFAHRISASYGICAPLSFFQGDLRRPYPTDIEMRLGFLANSDIGSTLNGSVAQKQINASELSKFDVPASTHQFTWISAGELHMTLPNSGGSVSMERTHKDAATADVEVMSTDSSSSSSSDSLG